MDADTCQRMTLVDQPWTYFGEVDASYCPGCARMIETTWGHFVNQDSPLDLECK